LTTASHERRLTSETYALEIESARQLHADDPRAQGILDQLEAWGREICNDE
jgi:hypothetical protein